MLAIRAVPGSLWRSAVGRHRRRDRRLLDYAHGSVVHPRRGGRPRGVRTSRPPRAPPPAAAAPSAPRIERSYARSRVGGAGRTGGRRAMVGHRRAARSSRRAVPRGGLPELPRARGAARSAPLRSRRHRRARRGRRRGRVGHADARREPPAQRRRVPRRSREEYTLHRAGGHRDPGRFHAPLGRPPAGPWRAAGSERSAGHPSALTRALRLREGATRPGSSPRASRCPGTTSRWSSSRRGGSFAASSPAPRASTRSYTPSAAGGSRSSCRGSA